MFGLDESSGFAAVGVYDLQDLQKKVVEQCHQMQPKVRPVFTFAEYEGVSICCAEIPAMDIVERPCYYTGAGKVKGSFIRVGDADCPMTDYEIYHYEAFRRHLHDDVRTVERADFSFFDRDRLARYILDKRAKKPMFSRLDEAQTYELLNISHQGIPTLAAVLNFCLYPQGFFPQLAVTGIVVPGLEIGDIDQSNARFLDNKRMEGTIADMLDEALAFCVRNMKVQTTIDPDTGKREDRPEYPINAIREALLNALIHRDYSIHTEGTPVQLVFFQDRLEIHSPGCLYGRMTVDQLGVARPDLRNPTLATMTESLTKAENRYSGIPTMRRELREAGNPAPLFENRRNEFVVTFYNRQQAMMGLQTWQGADQPNRLLTFCETPRTRKEIADFLGIKTIHYVMTQYITPAVERKELALTLPDKPQSRLQRYYWTGAK